MAMEYLVSGKTDVGAHSRDLLERFESPLIGQPISEQLTRFKKSRE